MRTIGTAAEKLRADDVSETAELAALCMAETPYFRRFFAGAEEDEVKRRLAPRIRRTLLWCAAHGGACIFRGAGGTVGGYEYHVDYGELKRMDPELWKAVYSFGDDGGREEPNLKRLLEVLDGFCSEGRRVTHILSLGVAPELRGDRRLIIELARHMLRLKRESDVLAADFSNRRLLSFSVLHGSFAVERLAEDSWLFVKS